MCESNLGRVLGVFVTSILLWSAVEARTLSPQKSCLTALSSFQKSAHLSQFNTDILDPQPHRWARLSAPAKSFASPQYSDFVWVLMEGNRYAVSRKNKEGALFSAPSIEEFLIIDDSRFEAQSMVFSPASSHMIFALTYSSGEEQALVIQKSSLKNAESGALSLQLDRPFVLPMAENSSQAKLYSRGAGHDFWLVDGTKTIRLILETEEGFRLGQELDFDVYFPSVSGLEHVRAVRSLAFDHSGQRGMVLVEADSGQRFIVPLFVESDENGSSISIEFEKALEVSSETHSLKFHPEKSYLVGVGSRSIEVYDFQESSERYEVMGSKTVALEFGFEIEDFHFFWDGQIETHMDESKKRQVYIGEVYGAVVLKNLQNQKTRLAWTKP